MTTMAMGDGLPLEDHREFTFHNDALHGMRLPLPYRNAALSFRRRARVVPLRVALFSSHHGERTSTGPITALVEERIRKGQLRKDPEQLHLASRLDALRVALADTDKHVLPSHKLHAALFSDAPAKGIAARAKAFAQQHYLHWSQSSTTTPRGLYVHGSVGVGKSFLMDLFAEALQEDGACHHRGVRRTHFHEFMLDVHERIHRFKQQHPKADPLPPVALSLAQEARLWCLDEFQVTDIADAMILKRLLTMLWMETHVANNKAGIGMVLIATSNRAPDSLYEGGLNRALFLPFIDTLHKHMDVFEMSGQKDYRREPPPNLQALQQEQSYSWPADSAETRQSLDRIFAAGGGEEHAQLPLPVRMNRHVLVPRGNDGCAWFDFTDLCDQPLGAADYWSVCQRYPVLIVDNVPQLTAARFNEARRFVTLIDALYESQTRVVLAAEVPLRDLFVGFEATVESKDGDEETGIRESTSTNEEMFVKGEGGSSSSAATTMIRTPDGEVEWSATGRIGVSLAQLSAVRDVSFSFQRAESRLVEMTNGTWGRGS